VAKHFRPLKISEVRPETDDCISVVLQVPEEWKEEFRYQAGQNITIRSSVGGEEIRRSYSICSSPQENELRVAIKKLEGGRFSEYAHSQLKPAMILDVLAPTGNFVFHLRPSNKKYYLAFAAGSGITPVISLLKTILLEEPSSRFTLVYGNRSRNAMIFREELMALKNAYPDRFQMIPVFSREKMDAPIFEGHIDANKCELIFKDLIPPADDREYLLCGPAPMIFTLRDWLMTHQIPEKKIHYELFSDPGSAAPLKTMDLTKDATTPENSQVTIRLDGVAADYIIPRRGPTILEAAIQAGADLPYACRAGVCASCRAKLVQGKVTMDQNYALAEEELEEGFILACQAHPATDKLVIDFDIR